MSTTDTLLEKISKLTLLEASELVKKMEEKFDISTSPTVLASGSSAAQTDSSEPEESSSFNVILKNFGSKKIDVIKVVREISGLPLKDAKDIVEAGDKSVKDDVDKGQAEEIKKKLEAAGASVELKPTS